MKELENLLEGNWWHDTTLLCIYLRDELQEESLATLVEQDKRPQRGTPPYHFWMSKGYQQEYGTDPIHTLPNCLLERMQGDDSLKEHGSKEGIQRSHGHINWVRYNGLERAMQVLGEALLEESRERHAVSLS